MKRLVLIFIAWPMFAQTVATIQESNFLSPIGDNKKFRGTVTLTPVRGCRLTRGGASFAFAARTFCIGLGPNGAATPAPANCDETSAEGVLDIKLVPTGAGTFPVGCSYTVSVSYRRVDGTLVSDTESWVIPNAQTYQIKDVRSSILPSPSSIVRLSQILDTTSGTGCLQKNSDGTVTPTGVACGTGSGGGGVPPANATWSTITGTWGANNRPWASQ